MHVLERNVVSLQGLLWEKERLGCQRAKVRQAERRTEEIKMGCMSSASRKVMTATRDDDEVCMIIADA